MTDAHKGIFLHIQASTPDLLSMSFPREFAQILYLRYSPGCKKKSRAWEKSAKDLYTNPRIELFYQFPIELDSYRPTFRLTWRDEHNDDVNQSRWEYIKKYLEDRGHVYKWVEDGGVVFEPADAPTPPSSDDEKT